jgi:hypothetical protein
VASGARCSCQGSPRRGQGGRDGFKPTEAQPVIASGATGAYVMFNCEDDKGPGFCYEEILRADEEEADSVVAIAKGEEHLTAVAAAAAAAAAPPAAAGGS